MSIFKFQSLKTRVTLFTLAIFVLGIWMLSFYASRKLNDDMAKQLGERQLTIAALVAKQIGYDMQERFEALRLVADGISSIPSNLPVLADASPVLADTSLVQANLDNRPLILRDFNAGAYVAGLDGTAIATVPHSIKRLGVNYIDRDYIGTALNEGKASVGRPVISRVFNSPIIGMGVPIKNHEGKVIGALAGVVNLDKPNFLDIVVDSRYGKTGYYILLDNKSRTIITSTGKSRVKYPQQARGINPLIDRYLDGYEGTGITTGSDGVEVLVSGMSIPAVGWSVVTVLPTAEAFAPIRALKRHILLATGLMTLLAAGLIWFMLRRELYPMFLTVKKLAALSKSNAAPELLPVSTNNEIGDLINGFNTLLSAMGKQSDTLKQSEFRWKFALEGTGDGLWDWNLETNQVFFSKTWKQMLGYGEEEIGDNVAEWEKRIHPEDKSEVFMVLNNYLAGKTPSYVIEHRLLCKQNDYKWILARGLIVQRDAEGKPLRMIGMHTDITERKFQEEYKNLRSRILEMLANGVSMEATLTAIIIGIERMHPDMLCSILLVDKEGKRLVNGVATSLPGFFNEANEGMEIGPDQGSCGAAAYSGERVIAEDISTHPNWVTLKELTNLAGLAACWAEPIFSSNHKVLGTLAIYHRHVYKPTVSAITLIEESAQLASIAIDRNAAEYNQRIAATAFETSKGMMITDARTVILRVNQAFTDITGYGAEDVIGKTPKILSSGRQDKYFYEAMRSTLNATGSWEGELWDKRKNGEIYPQYLIINTVKDDDGDVINYVASIEDISDSKSASEKIHNLAFYDSLTQLPNRRLLMDRLKHALTIKVRSDNSIGALLLLDIDHFKTLNETLGYDSGNLLLKQVADRLTKCVAEGDTVARLGGDEFVVLLEDLSNKVDDAAAQTEVLASKIMASFSYGYELSGHTYHTTVSIGATLFNDRDEDEDEDELLKQADIAMYQAKNSGRNTFCFFDPGMQRVIDARADIENELRKAIYRQQFQLYYQVQINHEGQALGAEALIRWKHPERGMIPPFDFIPLAEETGMILDVGEWVLDTACNQLKLWQANLVTRELSISVNVSAKQFNQPGFVDQVQQVLSRHAVDPAFLKLELTESMLLADVDTMISKMIALRKIGVGFELDDFGTGYSSLQYLKKLPLNQLKIDQSFIRDLINDDSDKAIIRTIISMAHSLNLKVIAEGIETKEQLEFLKDEGCNHYQGYYFSKPLPIDEFEIYLRTLQ